MSTDTFADIKLDRKYLSLNFEILCFQRYRFQVISPNAPFTVAIFDTLLGNRISTYVYVNWNKIVQYISRAYFSQSRRISVIYVYDLLKTRNTSFVFIDRAFEENCQSLFL